MGAGLNEDIRASAASALGWWIGAGVDMLVDDGPRDWLRPAAPAAPIPPAPEHPSRSVTAPDSLEAFQRWLAESPDVPDASAGAPRIAPAGSAAGGLMLIADLPDAEDIEAGTLFSGAAGRLLGRMLAAIGRDRASVYLVPLSPTRPAGGRLNTTTVEALAAIMRRHIALAAPRAVLLLGQAPARALAGLDLAAARGCLRDLNHDGGTVAAVTTFHPRFLLGQPACKAEAWADLRLLLGELSR